jgi:LysM repeat protein
MLHLIITLLMVCCISFANFANAAGNIVELNDSYPERHVVVKGDTLWSISGKFLKNPWLWPKVWQLNRDQIKNPHLIYPGDVVVLDKSGTSPQLRLLRETITLNPSIVFEPLEKSAIATIPLNIIAPFLNQPLVIEKNSLANSPRIIAGQDNRVVLSPGTRIYLDNISEGDAINWYVYRPGETLKDPISGETLGTEALYLGDARITKYGRPASADITSAKEEIFTRDRLVPVGEIVETNFVPRAPDELIEGRILGIYGGVAEAGTESIISISRGSDDGIEVGHVLAINRYGRVIKDPEYDREKAKLHATELKKTADADKKASIERLEPDQIKLPDERIGLMMVFRVFDRVSYGLIMQATQPIHKLDMVQTP